MENHTHTQGFWTTNSTTVLVVFLSPLSRNSPFSQQIKADSLIQFKEQILPFRDKLAKDFNLVTQKMNRSNPVI